MKVRFAVIQEAIWELLTPLPKIWSPDPLFTQTVALATLLVLQEIVEEQVADPFGMAHCLGSAAMVPEGLAGADVQAGSAMHWVVTQEEPAGAQVLVCCLWLAGHMPPQVLFVQVPHEQETAQSGAQFAAVSLQEQEPFPQ